ncbi:MAG TPA: M20/M25/M40 family metallo-hydrolase [Bryobacteraceae bacterium]|nr:M20/M25/M40 family metallo-hydrolase [Bryobacteraceae bacterium]
MTKFVSTRFASTALIVLLPALVRAQSAPMLRAHVEFLASDSMEGRACPSRSCDLAADYILAHFRAAGLETQVQTTEAVFEVRRGETVVHLKEAQLKTPALYANTKVQLDPDQNILAGKEVILDKTPELEPIYNATGDIFITHIPAGLRNVIGVLKGRDRKLRETYVLVTAHYDHVGLKPDGEGDLVFNGANDNASGVAGLIEIARAIASSATRPRRSLAFIAYFGEERGMVGSRYYAQHPIVPVAQTFAQVNFEQLGRPDDSEGPRVKGATVTGWDRSLVGQTLATAATPFGVRIYKHEKFSEVFFERSDNEALAKLGVPAHTISVAYGFPDYHGLGDEASKLDYTNMAIVTKALRRGVMALANRVTSLTPRAGSPAVSVPKVGSSPASPNPKRSRPSPKSPKS